MNNDIFGSDFARAYDHWHEQKDYEAECDVIEAVFRKHAAGEVRSILDLESGTGGQSILLARRGYIVWEIHDREVVTQREEGHQVRFFFPLEPARFMQSAELESVGLSPSLELDGQPDEQTWNVLFCGRAAPAG